MKDYGVDMLDLWVWVGKKGRSSCQVQHSQQRKKQAGLEDLRKDVVCM